MIKTFLRLIVLAFGLFMVTTGCSSYSGQKLGTIETALASGEKAKEVVPQGVPYNLARPEYTLSRTPPAAGQKNATYALAVTYQPDPTQRYSLRISPGIFTNPDFVVKLTAA